MCFSQPRAPYISIMVPSLDVQNFQDISLWHVSLIKINFRCVSDISLHRTSMLDVIQMLLMHDSDI